MTSDDIRRELVKHLRTNPAGLDAHQLAASTGQAEFRVRAELRVLRHRGLVRDIATSERHRWYLTARGYAEAYTAAYLDVSA